jgi:ketopantoate reductase
MADEASSRPTSTAEPEAVVVHLNRLVQPDTVVLLTQDGIGWWTDQRERGEEDARWLSWERVGRIVSQKTETELFGRNDELVGRISGELQDWTIGTWLARLVATYLQQAFEQSDSAADTEVALRR